MYCHKCGTKLFEDAEYCHKCGTKIKKENDEISPSLEPYVSPIIIDSWDDYIAGIKSREDEQLSAERLQEELAKSDQIPAPLNKISKIVTREKKQENVKGYIDKRVKETTQYSSAEELADKKISNLVVGICFAISTLLIFGVFLGASSKSLTVTGKVIVAIISICAGYGVATVADIIMVFRIGGKIMEAKSIELDFNKVIPFLNTYLTYLSCFDQWELYERKKVDYGPGLSKKITASLVNSVIDSIEQDTLKVSTKVDNGQDEIVMWIQPVKHNNYDVCELSYNIGFYLDKNNPLPNRYVKLVKSLPILRGAMEYFLNMVKAEDGEL